MGLPSHRAKHCEPLAQGWPRLPEKFGSRHPLHPDFEYLHLEQPSTSFFEGAALLGSDLPLPSALALAKDFTKLIKALMALENGSQAYPCEEC